LVNDMRIAIVNDLVMAVEALRRVLSRVPEHHIAWVARDGVEAVAKCTKDTPDLILMDLIMPIMDGVEATRQIMKQSPCAIIIVTVDVEKNSAKVFEALRYGALDAVDTPVLINSAQPEASQALLTKIATIAKLLGKSPPTSFHYPKPQALPPLIAIGSSTGGPKALSIILSRLPANFGAAIVIVQHVDAQFASGMISWLNDVTPLTVRKAASGDRPEVGTVLVASTNDHLSLQHNAMLNYIKEPLNYPYRPSIDVFFKSAAQYWTSPGTAVLLTGMGRDGAEGLGLLRHQGWYTIAQDQASCVVYGMPKAAVELKAAIEVLSPEAIASTLIHRTISRRH
jgi:two-component system, chemotaxis family, response regulator WspF